MSIWLALDVVDNENGCLHHVPDSHREGYRPHAVTSVLGFSQGIDYGDDNRARERTSIFSRATRSHTTG